MGSDQVGEIPTTSTPGTKPSVTVEIELPDGRKVIVEVPVLVVDRNNGSNHNQDKKQDSKTNNLGNTNNSNVELNKGHENDNSIKETTRKENTKIKKLPNTGFENDSLSGYGLAMLGFALTMLKRRKQK